MALIPAQFTAGVTLDVSVLLTAYQPPDWEALLYLRGPASVDLTAVADDRQFRFQADATATKTWVAGIYAYSLRVTNGADVVEVETGRLEVKPDLVAASGEFNALGHVRKVLAAIEAVIERRATRDQKSYRINNRELERTSIADLLLLRSQYKRELAREEAAAKGGGLLGRTVRVRV